VRERRREGRGKGESGEGDEVEDEVREWRDGREKGGTGLGIPLKICHEC
jgi:hypothetical protein